LPIPTGLRHIPEKFGYLLSSNARAVVIDSVVANAMMASELRQQSELLFATPRTSNARLMHSQRSRMAPCS
jgi:hypothetical protein